MLALGHRRLAGQHDAGPAEHAAEERGKWHRRLLKLGEDQHLLLARSDLLSDLAQAGELAAVVLGPGPVAEPLRGMIADLLETHQESQHESATLHAIDLLKLVGECLYGLLVERRLRARQQAEGLHLGLVG